MYIRPDVQSYVLLDYDKFDEIYAKGRAAALTKLKASVVRSFNCSFVRISFAVGMLIAAARCEAYASYASEIAIVGTAC